MCFIVSSKFLIVESLSVTHFRNGIPKLASGVLPKMVASGVLEKGGEGCVELREGFCHAFFVVYGNRAFCAEGCHFQGHDHTVVVVGCVVAAFEETWERPLDSARGDRGRGIRGG